MSLDDLIELLQDVRRQFPGAATARVVCPVDLSEPTYEGGQLLLGLMLGPDCHDLLERQTTKSVH